MKFNVKKNTQNSEV